MKSLASNPNASSDERTEIRDLGREVRGAPSIAGNYAHDVGIGVRGRPQHV